MILNGPRLLITPRQAWSSLIAGRSRSSGWLVAAALTAAVFPAAAVVAGHIGSAMSGHEEHAIATLRAAIGFTAVTGGALVMAPALTLLLLPLARWSRGEASPTRSGLIAMGILWPVWTAGVILAVPPLLGFGPEFGEIIWTGLAVIIAYRAIRAGAVGSLSVRRRWAGHFTLRALIAFFLLFVLITIAPAMTVRTLLGAATEIVPALPERAPLPLPPTPNW